MKEMHYSDINVAEELEAKESVTIFGGSTGALKQAIEEPFAPIRPMPFFPKEITPWPYF